ncbi:MAG: DEAD/DEAH box helicase family protein [Gammaproteobacteria bacterium]|nr:DEAD/DEAH box helicase family protein [Gammaproteobacteria bacterium]
MTDRQQRTASEWLQVIEQHLNDAGDGKWLEKLVCDLGPRIPDWDFQYVFNWKNWPEREKFVPGSSPVDLGIDNVGIRLDGSLVAIQCKARSGRAQLSINDLGTFIQNVADKRWKENWVVSNAQFGSNVAESNLRNESRPLKLVDFVAPVRELALEESLGVREDENLTAMQDEVVSAILSDLPSHAEKGHSGWNEGEARGHIVLPCGTGKTRIAYRISKEVVRAEGKGIVIVLVPSIALVKQIKKEFQKLARRDGISIRTLAVCSDVTAGQVKGRGSNSEERINLARDPTRDVSHARTYEVIGDTATNEQQVVDWLSDNLNREKEQFLAVFSTYQSSHNTAGGMRELKLKADLLICDEAHRTAGIKRIPVNGERLRNFTLCHDKDEFPATYRLYQTATPRVYSIGTKTQALLDADDTGWDVRSMHDVSTFGPEIYRLSYVDAVERNLLSDYRIIAWGIGEREAEEAQQIADQLNEASRTDEQDESRWDRSLAMRALTLAAFVAGCVPSTSIKSVIAFCNRVKISSELAQAVGSQPVQDWLKRYFKRLGITKQPAELKVEHVDATHTSNKRDNALEQLRIATEEQPFCISNVGIFGEGTDSPSLSAVAFLNPRKSPVDVIQAVGRAMRKSPDKTFGYILVPVVIPENHDPESFLRNSSPSHGWEELGQILQALRAHDGRIEDQLESLMEFYVPPPINEPAYHLIVAKEPYQQPKTFLLHTRSSTIEQVIAPKTDSDSSTIEKRLLSDSGSLMAVSDPSELTAYQRPKSVSAVVHDKDGSTSLQDLTYSVITPREGSEDANTWDPYQAVESTKSFIRLDRQRRKKQMRRVPPRKTKRPDRQQELGLRLLHLEKDTLTETGIHLNLLEKSGIQGGSVRDVNLLRSTVNTVARLLRNEDLEDVLAIRLGMENVERSSRGAADACTVSAIIWLNAAIMHARLEQAGIRELRSVEPLADSISHVIPALGLMNAWRKVLIKDYVPIFEIAIELLQDVAFRDSESVSDALRHLVKNAVSIAEQYANLGMDHAGELFNSVMGNQHSDGAFFTRPIAAAILAELALHASGDRDWLDERSWDQLRCFDPSCGSGTILVAMMSAIKRRIRLAGGDAATVKRFHRRAVEHLMIGADINHVALQLAACQLTLGDVEVAYDKINLYLMDYGPTGGNEDIDTVRTGSVELLLDERLFPVRDEIEALHHESPSTQLNLNRKETSTNLGDDLVESPVSFVLMNPPYTAWSSIGTKFDREIQQAIRGRLGDIWELKQSDEPILKGKKSSIATLFEAIALTLSSSSSGVMAFVRPSTVTTAEDARKVRKEFAELAHVDFVLTSHDPSNFSMSWDTSINECLIVMTHSEALPASPTRFINLHRFPESIEDVCDQIDRAVKGEQFNGSSVLWDYDRMKEGDWSPAVFADCELAELAYEALSKADHVTYDLVNSSTGRKPSPPQGNAEMAPYTIRYLEVLLTSKSTQPVANGE